MALKRQFKYNCKDIYNAANIAKDKGNKSRHDLYGDNLFYLLMFNFFI